ncbi:MAG: hypothetical protein ACI9S8_001561 [Chlamydiales bacterium]|jgi:hypothetical protein
MSFCSGWDTSLRNLGRIQDGQLIDFDQNGLVSEPYNKGMTASLWRTASWLGGVSKGRDDLLKISRVFDESATQFNRDPNIIENFSGAMEGVLVLSRTYEVDGKDNAVAMLQIIHRGAQDLLNSLQAPSERCSSVPILIQPRLNISERVRKKSAELREEDLSESFETDFTLGTSPAQQAFAVAHHGFLATLSPKLTSLTPPLAKCGTSITSDDFILIGDLSYNEENAVLMGTPPDGKMGFLLNSGRILRNTSIEKGLNMARGLKDALSQGADVLSKQFIEKGHPWKQKRYEVVIEEMAKAFQGVSNEISPYRVMEGLDLWKKGHPQKAGFCNQVMRALSKITVTERDFDFRAQYYDFVQELRKACEEPEFVLALAKGCLSEVDVFSPTNVLLNLCHVRYGEVQIFSFCESLVDSVLDSARVQVDCNEEDVDSIQDHDFDRIDKMPGGIGARRIAVQKGMFQGSSNLNFDPNMQCNIPYVLADVDLLMADHGEKQLRLLRMGSPTMEGFREGAEVTPDFRAFLYDRKRQDKKHVYISLQSSIPKPFYFGDETGRNKAIRELEIEFPDTFTCVILDQNSHFYEHPGQGDNSAEAFKDEFIGKMLGQPEVTGFYFPAKWKSEPGFRQELKSLFDKTHTLVFSDGEAPKGTLTVQEKKDFIEIYYAFLSLHILQKSGADSANISCKDAIDRAAKTNTLLLKLIMIMQGKGQDSESGRILKKTAHAPALMVKKQAIIGGRRRRLISALTVLNDSSIQERIRAAAQNENFGVNSNAGVHVQRSEGQSVAALFQER